MTSCRRCEHRLGRFGRQEGFTLIELLIAALIAVIVLGTGGTVLLAIQRDSNSDSNRSQAQETLDLEMQRMTSGIRQAVVPSTPASGYTNAVNLAGTPSSTGTVGSTTAYPQLSFYEYQGVGSADALHLITYECTTSSNPSCYVNNVACTSTACPTPTAFSTSSSSWTLAIGCPGGADTTDSLGACSNLNSGYIFENGLSAGAATWTGASTTALTSTGNFPVTVALSAQVKQGVHSNVTNTISLVQTVTPQLESCQVIQCS